MQHGSGQVSPPPQSSGASVDDLMRPAVQKRILILANSVLAGDATGKHVCDVARSLLSEGYAVSVCYDGVFTRQDADIRSISVAIKPGDALPEADLLILEYAGWYRLADRIRASRARSIFWYHGVTPPELWGTDIDRDAIERSVFGTGLARYADVVVADSPFGAAELARHTGMEPGLIRVIPWPVDVEAFKRTTPADVLGALRRRLGTVDGQIVLFVGRMAGNKRIDLLVAAIHLLRERYPDLVLAIVGDDRSSRAYAECADRIRSQISELGLQGQVQVLGKVPSIEPYYHLAHILVLPSEHEGFGVPLIEAMAAGVPVVASDAGAMPWVIGADTEEPAGLVFHSGSADELANAISTVLSDRDLATTLSARGSKRVALFSPEIFRHRTLNVVRSVLSLAAKTSTDSVRPDPMLERADVALREYRVRSFVPVVGRLIEWLRVNLTSHVKEAYVDRITERQVMFNIATANRMNQLDRRIVAQDEIIARLRSELDCARKQLTSEDACDV